MRTRFRTLLGAALAVAMLGATGFAADAAKLGSNPADNPDLLDRKLEPNRYDGARRCVDRAPKGAKKLAAFMRRYGRRRAAVGIIRCESLGSSLSVHSEGRAVDFGLDARRKGQKRAAKGLIRTWLARDDKGRRNALARRMGVQMIIYNCRIWQAGERGMRTYGYCAGGRRGVNPTAAHIDHMHVELTRPAAKLKTSYWRFIRAGGDPEQAAPEASQKGGLSPSR